jgi:hypothetical protein
VAELLLHRSRSPVREDASALDGLRGRNGSAALLSRPMPGLIVWSCRKWYLVGLIGGYDGIL